MIDKRIRLIVDEKDLKYSKKQLQNLNSSKTENKPKLY